MLQRARGWIKDQPFLLPAETNRVHLLLQNFQFFSSLPYMSVGTYELLKATVDNPTQSKSREAELRKLQAITKILDATEVCLRGAFSPLS